MPESPPTSEKFLSTVNAIPIAVTTEVSLWVKAIIDAGATMLEESEVDTAKNLTAQKVAVIIGETSEDELQRIIEKYEAIFADQDTLSVRYMFLFAGKSPVPAIGHDRLRIIDVHEMSPNDFARKTGRSLYKARLPFFLRTGYEVEICEDIETVKDVRYRKIVLRSYRYSKLQKLIQEEEKKLVLLEAKEGPDRQIDQIVALERAIRSHKEKLKHIREDEIEYETTHLYIHNKELYQLQDGTMVKILDDDSVLAQVPGGRFSQSGPIRLAEFRNTETEE